MSETRRQVFSRRGPFYSCIVAGNIRKQKNDYDNNKNKNVSDVATVDLGVNCKINGFYTISLKRHLRLNVF